MALDKDSHGWWIFQSFRELTQCWWFCEILSKLWTSDVLQLGLLLPLPDIHHSNLNLSSPFVQFSECANPTYCHPSLVIFFNTSLAAGELPLAFEASFIMTLLKKLGLDSSVPSTIWNYTFLSKLLERIVSNHITDHLTYNNMIPFTPQKMTFHRNSADKGASRPNGST